MIDSSQCWLKDQCKKYKSESAECRNQDIFCMKLFKLDSLYNLSQLSFNQRKKIDLRLDSSRVDEDTFIKLKGIQETIEDFISRGGNLYLYSTITGNGKSAWAIRLLQSYFNAIWYKCDIECKGLFISVPRYLLAIKNNISEKDEYAGFIKDNVYTADVVIWDDLGTKAATSFEHENLLSIIDSRISSGKSNIFTSNILPDDLREIAGDRLYSRIINYSTCLPFNGEDKRGAI